MPRPRKSMPDRPERSRTPNKAQRRWGHKSLTAQDPPPTDEELIARYTRAKAAGACVCKPWPCTPETGCASACKACKDAGPLFTREDLRYLEGA